MDDEELRGRLRRVEASVTVIEFVVLGAVWIWTTNHFAHRLMDAYHWEEGSAGPCAGLAMLAAIVLFVGGIRWGQNYPRPRRPRDGDSV